MYVCMYVYGNIYIYICLSLFDPMSHNYALGFPIFASTKIVRHKRVGPLSLKSPADAWQQLVQRVLAARKQHGLPLTVHMPQDPYTAFGFFSGGIRVEGTAGEYVRARVGVRDGE